MKRLIFCGTCLLSATIGFSQLQAPATFEGLPLPGSDTFYVNYSQPGQDVGFLDGPAYFPCVYDTSMGYRFWSSGFSYSNKTDTLSGGFANQYSARPGMGAHSSGQYAVAFGVVNYVNVSFPVAGFFVTNNAYSYHSMLQGDPFAKKFGGLSGQDPDWFKMDVYGYQNDVPVGDTVEFYLADFRFADSDSDYIVRDWHWVDLSNAALGGADSLVFYLSSSDTGQFGMNTPAYFCIDSMATYPVTSISNDPSPSEISVFPNPATDYLLIQTGDFDTCKVRILNLYGSVLKVDHISDGNARMAIGDLPTGMYFLAVWHHDQCISTVRFIKQ